jgi:hypothetical protein
MRAWNILLAGLLFAGCSSAIAGPRFVESHTAVDQITQGIEDGLKCGLGYTDPGRIANCAMTMSRAVQRLSPDPAAYNVGLFFETWRDLDVDWTSDQPLVKSHQVPEAMVQAEESAAKMLYALYVNARDRLGISDKELLSLTKLTTPGKAITLARLQYWAAHTH